MLAAAFASEPIELFVGGTTVVAEVADTPVARRMGLMGRASLSPDSGMLFVFPKESERSFWMKNTLIPLDMIFIDDRGEIVGIVHNATPNTLTGRSVGQISLYVLEVRGGYAKENQIEAGSWVDLSEAIR